MISDAADRISFISFGHTTIGSHSGEHSPQSVLESITVGTPIEITGTPSVSIPNDIRGFPIPLPGDIPVFALICAVGGLISMVGDLAASAIKRNYDIKDYGKLIPGHGGILDRFDSVIITAPIIFYMAVILM